MSLSPYGQRLVDRSMPAAQARAARAESGTLPRLCISERVLGDLYLIAAGGLSPLTGFMGSEDYESVLEEMTLENGLPWTIPVTLPITAEAASAFSEGEPIVLIAPDGEAAALMNVREMFGWDRDREARAIYGTTDRRHPGVAALDRMGDVLVAGEIRYLYPHDISGFPAHNLTPAETRAVIQRQGWQSVAAFQTRNPIHRAHEYLQKCAMEVVDGLLIHPVVGDTKDDDVPAGVRMACYEAILDSYYPTDRVLLAVLPVAMRYAGPREAVFHAIIRRNYGCTHFIVGRDHAGVGDFYGTYDAQRIFDRFDPSAIGITPLCFEHSFYCGRCQQMATTRSCPHTQGDRIHLSGTRVREMLSSGERPPVEFTRPEVADILVRAYSRTQAA